MPENVYNESISAWYDKIMEAGYNPRDHAVAAEAIKAILGSRNKVLELGIGTGLLAEQLILRGINLTGFDFSKDMLRIAEGRLEYKVRLFHQDVVHLDLPEKNYEAAVSQGGVWVAIREGNCLDSHIIGYDRNLQGLKRVAEHLDMNGLLIINYGPAQLNGSITLAEGAEYSQEVNFSTGRPNQTYSKGYYVKKYGLIVAEQHCEYARFNEKETARLMDEAGFLTVGKDKSDSFLVFQKK